MPVSRRDFLKLGGASLLLRANASTVESSSPGDSASPTVVPEYSRTLERVLVCVPADTIGHGDNGARGGIPLSKFLDYAFRDALEALPDYTTLHIAARGEQRDLGLELARRAGKRTTKLHLVSTPGLEIDLWAQDLGEPFLVEGREKFLVSMGWSDKMGEAGTMAANRKRVAELLFGAEAVVDAGAAFEAGNLAFDTRKGASRVLLGHNTVLRTISAYADRGESESPTSVREKIAAAFGGEAIEMGDSRQTPALQHIDLAFLILADGIAVCSRIGDEGSSDEQRELERYAAQLRELGYDVSFLDHFLEDVRRTRSSVNAVPFVDRTTGAKRILFPVFPEEVRGEAQTVNRAALSGKGARAYDTYRDLGYEPIPLRDVTHPLGGNTHCILNVLA